jgi:outer membrane protein assembly factor BamB
MRPPLALLVLALTSPPLWAEDWPRYRGPRGDGSWNAPPLPDRWPDAPLTPRWRVPIGPGYAGVSVAAGRVYTLDRKPVEPAPKDGPDGDERVLCLDADTGRPLWSHTYPVRYGPLGGYANGPRTTPTVHDGRVYTLGAVGHLVCFDAATGKVLWQRDTVRQDRARVPEWGFAASPLIDGDRVIVHVGAEPDGGLIAFDRHTGREVWRSLPDPAGYCTPVLIDAPAGRQLVAWTPENVRGVDPDTGKPLWALPYKVTYGVSIAGPVYRDGIVFVTGYWEGSRAIRLGPASTDAKLLWEERRGLNGLMAQPLVRGGYVYTLDKSRGLVCVELKTGKQLWEDHRLTKRGRNPHASIVWLGDSDRVLFLEAGGDLVLARLTPDGYVERARTRLLPRQAWAHPAFAGGRVYARTDGGERPKGGTFELFCFDLPPRR